MKIRILVLLIALLAVSYNVNCQPNNLQQAIDDARRTAANGENYGILVMPNSLLAASFPIGIYFFYNNPKPFCYSYLIPGEWVPLPKRGGMMLSKNGATANVNFRPPSRLQNAVGATILERGRNLVVRELESALHQPLVGVQLVPFDSARAGTWQLKADPVKHRDGRVSPLPLYILVDLSPHTIAEINVRDSGNDEDLARRIIAELKTTTVAECYSAELERMLKVLHGGR